MSSDLVITSVSVPPNLVCIPTMSEDPDDCSKHSHVPGRKVINVEVEAAEHSDAAAAGLGALVGRRVRLVLDE